METSTRRCERPPPGGARAYGRGSTPADRMDTERPCAESQSSSWGFRWFVPIYWSRRTIQSAPSRCWPTRSCVGCPQSSTFDPSGFAHNRDRLLQADVARLFFEGVLRLAKSAQLISKEHFTVDGTLMEAWASLKSFKPKTKGDDDRDPPEGGSNPTSNFHGEKRSNEREAAQPCFLIPGISSWRIATGYVSMSVWALPMGTRSASTL